MIKDIFLEKDAIHNKNSLHIRTKKTKDGYLLRNKKFMDEIKECCKDFNEVSVSYVYNGKIISAKDEVKRMLKLREKRIQILSVTQDERTKVITVNFADK
ncbi:MAG: hypothetical protein LBL90_08240 [Prevotellaceae bacterium]|jgi:uncharacterized protein involved in tolerance to divalent cations|nr:hypothetical protein [Prevotellaceae bacterium]